MQLARQMFDPTVSTRSLVRATQSDQFDMDRGTVKYHECVYAEAAMMCDRMMRSTLEKRLVATAGITTLHYTEFECYDETPMPVAVKQFEFHADPTGFLEIVSGLCPGAISSTSQGPVVLPHMLPSVLSKPRTDTGTAKLFQIQSAFSLLIQIEMAGARKHVIVHSQAINNLQVLDRVTADTTAHALRQVWGLSLGHKRVSSMHSRCDL
eukprot:9481849-Pyramimonas_sp.AAC.1